MGSCTVLNSVPSKFMSPLACECDFFLIGSFQMWSNYKEGSNPMAGVLIRGKFRHRDPNTQRESNVQTRQRSEGVCLQARKWGGLLATTGNQGESRRDSSLESSEGVWLYQHLDFRHLASSTVRVSISVVLSHPGNLVICHSHPRKLIQKAFWL